jgi:hypothetical protein
MGQPAPACLLVRNRRCFIRFRIPSSLGERWGRVEMVRSLGTRDPRRARAIVARLGYRLPHLWALMRRRPARNEAELRQLADDWRRLRPVAAGLRGNLPQHPRFQRRDGVPRPNGRGGSCRNHLLRLPRREAEQTGVHRSP